MKLRSTSSLALALIVATVNASAGILEAAPVLPATIAKTLRPMGSSKWLGNGAMGVTLGANTSVPHERRDCWRETYFTAQVTYPRTYCVLPPELNTILSKKEIAALSNPGSGISVDVSVHRLMYPRAKGQYELLACVTRSGPWLAEITHKDTCPGFTDHFMAPFNNFDPREPGQGGPFPTFAWDGSRDGLPPNMGWLTDPVPWSIEFKGGKCPGNTMTTCPGETVGQTPGSEPPPPIIY